MMLEAANTTHGRLNLPVNSRTTEIKLLLLLPVQWDSLLLPPAPGEPESSLFTVRQWLPTALRPATCQ